jgi:hypothetical protein
LPAPALPPTRHIDEGGHGDALRLRLGQAGPSVPHVLVVFLVCFVGPAVAPRWTFAITTSAAILASVIILWWLDGREEIAIERGRLIRRRGVLGWVRTRSVRLDEIAEVVPQRWPLRQLRLRMRAGPDWSLVVGLGHRPETFAWLHRRIERALHRRED